VAGVRYSFWDFCNVAMGGHLVVAGNMDVAFPRSEIVRNQCRRPTDAYANAVWAGRHMHSLLVPPDKHLGRERLTTSAASRLLPATGPRLLQGFKGEVFETFVHSGGSLIDISDNHSDGLFNVCALGRAEFKARPAVVKHGPDDAATQG
jgi:hypothetical protein